MDLQGRSAIVTGGAGGLGAATVRRLVELGMGVVVFDRHHDGRRRSPPSSATARPPSAAT